MQPLAPLPRITHDLPRLRGTLKATPADFDVDEIPAYQPCGEGEHLSQREQRRFHAREVVPAGPIFGPKMRQSRGEPHRREQRVLAAAGLALDDLRGHGKLLTGTRPANLLWIDDLEVAQHAQDSLVFRFTLPRGSYATVVLNEFVEPQGATPPLSGEADHVPNA